MTKLENNSSSHNRGVFSLRILFIFTNLLIDKYKYKQVFRSSGISFHRGGFGPVESVQTPNPFAGRTLNTANKSAVLK